ncbi:UNVERIFIED_CONTAM: hypothetical protein Scaly_1652400 [Sesamum calycinum]|uniref:Retrotransposon gag domain-containing protein n=1 Tax=Sesamum calycinum TaxID=2727403 RepID=A0AAW2NS48_9LAMI
MDTQGKVVKPVNSKLAISKSSSSSTKSVGITTRNMSKKLKESSQMSPLVEYVEKNLHSPSYASESDANNLLRPLFVPCLATPSQQMWLQLCLKMSMVYQPPKFQQFDGKGNPKQHVAHFVETCNNARTYGDHLVKQFVRSLKGNAFDWYTDLDAGPIDGWEQLEQEFLNRFYNTRRTINMIKLTNSRQWKEEPVVDYINRWRNLSLNCKDRLSEASAIEMCIQGMHWELCYILQAIKLKTFGELATRAHEIEMSINYKEDEYSVDPNDDDGDATP